MSTDFQLTAEPRGDMGKGASRRLRRTGMVPGIVYGGGQDPAAVSLIQSEVMKHLEHDEFYSSILKLNLGGGVEKVILKDMQRHPSKPVLLHIDLQRVSDTTAIRVHVPLHFVGESVAPGVKKGGLPSRKMIDVEVVCKAGDLPDHLVVDASALDIGQVVHLSDIKLPDGVELTALKYGARQDLPVLAVMATRASAGGG